MTNLEKLKLVVKHIQFMIDEKILDEEICGNLQEEIYSTMEILVDCNEELEEEFKQEMENFKKIL